MYVLDTEAALKDGCDLPRSGLYRGEVCAFVSSNEEGDNVLVTLPDSLDPEKVYTVKYRHIIEVKNRQLR